MRSVKYFKYVIIALSIIALLYLILFIQDRNELNYTIEENVQMTNIESDYIKINEAVYVKYDNNAIKQIMLQLKDKTGFRIKVQNNEMFINYEENKSNQEYEMHLIKIIKGKLKSLYINDEKQ
ncbi:hypothetical protein GCM10023142_26210 [Anaerocolumna aminovalerica]|jgi:ABC-type anion transport system duplicated permease subunit|uniref:Uncharacterized protein n=1 Tax=Anaerocolumna aminovalerica TaxID=1527 RepID=A0A1I5HLV0_9FIRM|nr:hypothetical protein [Anaerocolumna aminovalerica]MBU5331478.1 hypothetical protein [Anaerocolumna aminovalerica]MDU6263570.1 hypothetical protein [Anaerocolumna aminovalerica]SFO49292.1 hypothetical protein SAMN04489757_13138 [Anaerocolumna aminovalerica]